MFTLSGRAEKLYAESGGPYGPASQARAAVAAGAAPDTSATPPGRHLVTTQQWCDASLSPGPGLPATTRDIAIQCLDQEAEPACDFTEEEITIARRPGEKLGFGLRFEGGGRASECVRRLYIQVTRDII